MTDRDALQLVWALTRGRGRCWRALRYLDGPKLDRWEVVWLPADDLERFAKLAPALAYHHDLALPAVPYLDKFSFRLSADASCLWARVESGKQLANLRRFTPGPTVVIREGESVRHVALWALRKPLGPMDAERAVRRIQHALFAPKKYATSGFTFPAPGGMIRDGRARPCAVRAVFVQEDAIYGAGRIVRRLKDPPEVDPSMWRRR